MELLQLAMFVRVPVVVSTYINRVTCHPEDLSAKLWLPCGAVGVEHAVAAATEQQQPIAASLVAYDSLIED
jgi:hypothetical protein